MHILFISNYFPPEVNAPATRLFEHAKVWVKEGITVDVLTSIPNFPEGKVYDGYDNSYREEDRDGIRVARVPMYVTANKGTLKRTFSFISFMLSACWYARKMKRPSVVVATSPQFFAAFAGYFVARRFKVPFVLEIRDLWPESIVAVGAVKRNAIIRFFERLELFLYKKADRIVVLTNAFKKFIEAKNIPSEKITVLKNGADLEAWAKPLDEHKISDYKKKLGLENKFVASYIGTIGMAHRADILLEAAQLCKDPDIVFMLVGTGAKRKEIEAQQAQLQLPNFLLLDKVPKDQVKYLLAVTDASIVHLKASDLFKTVIPSKIFEAMATRTPIVLGVEGEVKEIIDEAGAGIPITPERADELVDAVVRLKSNPSLYKEIAESGFEHVNMYYDRTKLARKYLHELSKVLDKPFQLDNKAMESTI